MRDVCWSFCVIANHNVDECHLLNLTHTHTRDTHTHTHTRDTGCYSESKRSLEVTHRDHASYTLDSNRHRGCLHQGTNRREFPPLVKCFLIGGVSLICTVDIHRRITHMLWFLSPCLLYMVLYDYNTEIINKKKLALRYSMYLNVCCAININVYNIFYNTERDRRSCIICMLTNMTFSVGMQLALRRLIAPNQYPLVQTRLIFEELLCLGFLV